MTTPPPINTFSRTIATRFDGLHALVFSGYDSAWNMSVKARLWNAPDLSDARDVTLQGWAQVREMVAAFVQNRLVTLDHDGASLMVREYIVSNDSTWPVADSYQWGTDISGVPCISKAFNSDTVLMLCYQHDSGTNFTAAVRNPSGQPKWTSANFNLEPPHTLPSIALDLVSNLHGGWLAPWIRDGSHSLGLLTFGVASGNPVLKSWQVDYITDANDPKQPNHLIYGDMAPEMEDPGVTVCQVGELTHVCYQRSRMLGSEDRCGAHLVQPTVIAIDANLKPSEVAVVPVQVWHSLMLRQPVISTRGALWVLARTANPDCSWSWCVSKIVNGKVTVLPAFSSASTSGFCSHSTDGFIAVWDSADKPVIRQLPFA